jgi:DNA-binding LytR/AlgR family response regulator
MKLLIYDPNRERAEKLRFLIQSYFSHVKANYQLTIYLKESSALGGITQEPLGYDSAFIHLDSLACADHITKAIRKISSKTALAFYGGDYQQLCQLLIYRPSAYLPDPDNRIEVGRILTRLHREWTETKRFFQVREQDRIERIPYDQIDYFESTNRKVYLYLSRGSKVYQFAAKLDDVEQAIGYDRFLRCHQSFLVNLDQVCRLDRVMKRFELLSGKSVEISKRRWNEAEEIFTHQNVDR